MKEATVDLWGFDCDVRCITTNGTLESDGSAVMGAGCALEAVQRCRFLPQSYGRMISRYGNQVFLIEDMLMFPVKHQVWQKADISLIHRSLLQLNALIQLYGWTNVALPRPGCGLGGLLWPELREEIEHWFGQSVIAETVTFIGYPGKP